MKQAIFTIFAVICLVVAILASGIVICMYTPQITQNLTRATALVDTAQFSREQLVKAADITRAYVSGHASKEDVYKTIEEINKEANTEFKDLEGIDFAAVSEQYALDSNSMSHLSDVQKFFANLRIAFGICLFGVALFSILLLVFCGPGALGRAFKWAGAIVLIAIIAVIAWAIIDFNNMFNWLHSLFFSQGSWLFSSTSLLISMYPTAFWTGMGAICVAISAVESIILLFIGKLLK